MKKYPRIVFYGTPQFAVASLDAVVTAGYDVAAVVTAPDKPAGRGLHLSSSDVKKYALEKRIMVLQPEKLRDESFLSTLRQLSPDLQVIVAFRKLPAEVWKLPPLGTFNLHASLLPKFRGAAPINHAIISGEKETGVTTFFLQEEIDTGNILFKEKVMIGDDETAGELHDELMSVGSKLVVKTIDSIVSGTVSPVPQPEIPDVARYKAPKIHKEDCRIDVSKSVDDVYNLVRGLSPHPGSFLEANTSAGISVHLRILEAKPEKITHTSTPGSFLTDGKRYLKLVLSDGFLNITKLQLSGRKPLETEAFLRGSGKLFL